MTDQPEHRLYGQSSNLFLTRKAAEDLLIFGGVAEDASRWTLILSYRAAQMIWFHLTKLLYPDKADMVTALVSTAPLRSTNIPSITTHATVSKKAAAEKAKDKYFIHGRAPNNTWEIGLTDYEAHRLWTVLDVALFPTGWQQEKPAPDDEI